MSFENIFFIVPNPLLSGVIWFILLSVLAYLSRSSAHQLILSITRVLHNAFKLSSTSLIRAQSKLAERNQAVLLAAGREGAEHIIIREFERIESTVRNDLAGFPELRRKLTETISQIDEEYHQSTDVPPDPPGWVKAVEAIAQIQSNGDPTVHKILGNIQTALNDAQKTAIEEYRNTCRKRHELLRKMVPEWRDVNQSLTTADKSINSLQERLKVVDQNMQDQEAIMGKTDHAMNKLSSSSLTDFFVSGFVLLIAAGGAMINFHLIARPMAEMVGGTSFIGAFKVADISALVIILVEISMGLFLMESLRITRMFPVIRALKDNMRIRMLWITFGILFSLASVEAGLAFMREIIMQDDLATNAILRGGGEGVIASEYLWITTVAQMGMGFILPFALVFMAIPLETFIHSSRTVMGSLGVSLLRSMAYLSRLMGNFCRYVGHTLLHLYDLLAFAPLWIERLVTNRGQRSASPVRGQNDENDHHSTLAVKGAHS